MLSFNALTTGYLVLIFLVIIICSMYLQKAYQNTLTYVAINMFGMQSPTRILHQFYFHKSPDSAAGIKLRRWTYGFNSVYGSIHTYMEL